MVPFAHISKPLHQHLPRADLSFLSVSGTTQDRNMRVISHLGRENTFSSAADVGMK
jgi:hypothetical protein